jgi:hypothetical protein
VLDTASEAASERALRILFVVRGATLHRFSLLIPALAERGHEVHIGFAPNQDWEASGATVLRPKVQELVDELCSRHPRVSYSIAPRRDESDGWLGVARLVRGAADLALTSSDRFAGLHGSRPRHRARARVLDGLEQAEGLEPVGRWLTVGLGRTLVAGSNGRRSRWVSGVASRLEDAIPTSAEIDRYVEELSPDVVLATGTYRHVSAEVEFLKSARRLGVPSGVVVTSWDSLVSKGSLKFVPERVFVWNEIQAKDAVTLHRIPPDRVRVTGAHGFDEWFERRPSRSREELLAQIGLDPSEPYVLYLCSSNAIVHRDEVEFVRRWVDALRSSSDDRLRRINVVVRPYPGGSATDAEWKVLAGLERVAVWPARGTVPVGTEARADFFDSLAHSAAVVGINTTSMIEAAILGKSVLTVIVPEFAQLTTVHFQYLLAENGGFLHVAESLDQHVEQLGGALGEDALGAERRRRFIESFVRPAGLERPAAPVTVAEIEELARASVRRTLPPSTRALRVALSVEAGLNEAYGSYRDLRKRRRRARAVAAGS